MTCPSGWRCLEPEHVTALLHAALGRGAGEGGDEEEGEIAVVLTPHRGLGPGPQGRQVARRNAEPKKRHHPSTPYERMQR